MRPWTTTLPLLLQPLQTRQETTQFTSRFHYSTAKKKKRLFFALGKSLNVMFCGWEKRQNSPEFDWWLVVISLHDRQTHADMHWSCCQVAAVSLIWDRKSCLTVMFKKKSCKRISGTGRRTVVIFFFFLDKKELHRDDEHKTQRWSAAVVLAFEPWNEETTCDP